MWGRGVVHAAGVRQHLDGVPPVAQPAECASIQAKMNWELMDPLLFSFVVPLAPGLTEEGEGGCRRAKPRPHNHR